jgi:monoamine oxidase
MTMQARETDVVVVGAGYAGLTAALRLTQAGRSVVVLEARDRVGGRVYTETLPDGTWLDFGGTWIGPGQDYAYALAQEMGVGTYPTYNTGESLLILEDGKIVRNAGSFPLSGLFSAAALLLVLDEFESMGKQIPLEAPWYAPQARAWDKQTVGAWIDSQFDDSLASARAALNAVMTGTYTSDPAEVSLLHALYQIRSFGGYLRLISVDGGNQQDRILGGAQAIANRIAARLGDAIRLSSPVRQVTQDNRGVEVVADMGAVRAQRVIVTVPVTLTGQVRFDPPLPAERALLIQRVPAGSVIKVLVMYDEPFWRADGLTGQSFAITEPVAGSYDGSTDTGRPGLLIAFAFGPHARALARVSAAERRRTFLDALAKRFGPQAASPVQYFEHDWADEVWSRGCYMAHFPPGVLTGFGPALRAPVGRIHWAGTETSSAFHGSINGAIESGERAAQEVLRA